MNPEIKALWLEALRSGEYKQTTGVLNDGCRYCCLGVLTDIAVQQGLGKWEKLNTCTTFSFNDSTGSAANSAALSPSTRKWSGLESCNGQFRPEVLVPNFLYSNPIISLDELNDEKMPFNQIADVIQYFF